MNLYFRSNIPINDNKNNCINYFILQYRANNTKEIFDLCYNCVSKKINLVIIMVSKFIRYFFNYFLFLII